MAIHKHSRQVSSKLSSATFSDWLLCRGDVSLVASGTFSGTLSVQRLQEQFMDKATGIPKDSNKIITLTTTHTSPFAAKELEPIGAYYRIGFTSYTSGTADTTITYANNLGC